MLRCSYCNFGTISERSMAAHMRERHPEILAKDLRQFQKRNWYGTLRPVDDNTLMNNLYLFYYIDSFNMSRDVNFTSEPTFEGAGGEFLGGGATGSWDNNDTIAVAAVAASTTTWSPSWHEAPVYEPPAVEERSYFHTPSHESSSDYSSSSSSSDYSSSSSSDCGSSGGGGGCD